MLDDRYSGRHSAASPAAVAAYEDAVLQVAAHRPGASEALAAALAASPDMIAAHALQGFGAVLLARAETFPPARNALALARRAMARGAATDSEEALVGALGEAVEGRMLAASAILDRHLQSNPCDFAALKLAHGLRFISGDGQGMLATTSRCLPAWRPDMPGFGFVLGCHAFGLEEAGDLANAERAGLRAVEHEPRDAWGLHAVSHVYEMDGRLTAGIALLDSARPMWRQCHNFSYHMAWHLALFHLSRGRADLALAVYDADVRPVATDDFRDIANAVSLLWRLKQEDADTGSRWHELEQLARKRATDTTLVFASLHHLLTLLACGDHAAARGLVASIERRARDGGGDQAAVAATVGAGLGQALVGSSQTHGLRPDLARLARDLPLIGGSHAQRDVFLRSLALLAAEGGRASEAHAVLDFRRRQRVDDRFSALVRERLAGAQKTSGLKLAS